MNLKVDKTNKLVMVENILKNLNLNKLPEYIVRIKDKS